MLGIVFLTVVPHNFCSQPWNATQDFFEETQPGLVSQFLECKPSAMFVYDRCGQLVDELKMFSTSPQDEVHEWLVRIPHPFPHFSIQGAKEIIKTDSAQRSSNKCKKYLLKTYSYHGNILNAI